MMEHGSYDSFWRERNILPHLDGIQTAVLNVGGWYDAEDLYGALKIYQAIENKCPGIVNHLVMGPWVHGGWARKDGNRLGEIWVNGSEASDYYQSHVELPFFECHLKGEGKTDFPEALMYDTGLCRWDSLSSWPPKKVSEKTLFLGPGHALEEAAQTTGKGDVYDEYVSDPQRPVPHTGKIENGWNSDFMIADQRFAARRPDVLSYETRSLPEDVTVTGEIVVELFVSTTGTDADWFVKVVDAYPENEPDYEGISDKTHMGEYQSLVRLGVMRGKFRSGFEKPEPLGPGQVTRVKFSLDDICHTFKKGHKLMVQVQSSCFPLFDRNPQKFVDIYSAEEKDFQKATHRIYRSGEYPSGITFLEWKRGK
jgi:putative CocE/NonD family hydrolase